MNTRCRSLANRIPTLLAHAHRLPKPGLRSAVLGGKSMLLIGAQDRHRTMVQRPRRSTKETCSFDVDLDKRARIPSPAPVKHEHEHRATLCTAYLGWGTSSAHVPGWMCAGMFNAWRLEGDRTSGWRWRMPGQALNIHRSNEEMEIYNACGELS